MTIGRRAFLAGSVASLGAGRAFAVDAAAPEEQP